MVDDGSSPDASVPELSYEPRFAIRLAPGLSAQIDALPERLRRSIRGRLEQLAIRPRAPVAPRVRGRILAMDFDALYEVDNQLRTVTVLDVMTPA